MRFELKPSQAKYSDQELLADIQRVAAECAPTPLTQKIYDARGSASSTTLRSRFGNWATVLRKAGISTLAAARVHYTDQQLLDDLRRVNQELGDSPLTPSAYEDMGVCQARVLVRRFGSSWLDVLRVAGIATTRCPTRTEPEGLLSDIRAVATRLGTKAITFDDYANNGGRFSTVPFRRHFGSWRNAVEAAGLELRRPLLRRIADEELFA